MFTFGSKRFQKISSSTTIVSKIIAILLIVLLSLSSVSVASATETGEVASSSSDSYSAEINYIDLIYSIRGYYFNEEVTNLSTYWSSLSSSSFYEMFTMCYGGISYDSVNNCYYLIFPHNVSIVEITYDLYPLTQYIYDKAYLHFGCTWNGFVPNGVDASTTLEESQGEGSLYYTTVPTLRPNLSSLCSMLEYTFDDTPNDSQIANRGTSWGLVGLTSIFANNYATSPDGWTSFQDFCHNHFVSSSESNRTYLYADANVCSIQINSADVTNQRYLSVACGWNFVEKNYFKLYDTGIKLNGENKYVLNYMAAQVFSAVGNLQSQLASQFSSWQSAVDDYLSQICNSLSSILSPSPTPSITPMPDIHAWLTPVLNDANTYKSTYSNAVDFMKEETSYLYSNYQYIRYVLYFSGMGVCMVALFFTLRKRGG